jgi:hypothetical protein
MSRSSRLVLQILLPILVLAAAAGPASAFDILGVTFYDNQLIDISSSTGAATLVGNLSSNESAYGLATYAGKLYTFDSNADRVLQLSPTSGQTVASFNVGIGPVLGQGGFTFSNTGTGFLASILDPSTDNVVNDLYKFTLGSTSPTLLHTTVSLGALAFGSNGVLYALGKSDGMLYSVDTTTGATTALASLNYSAGSPFESLMAGPGGLLYATLDDRLFLIDPTTGNATPIDPDPDNYTGFSSITGIVSAAAVPEPTSFVLMGTALAVALGMRRSLRR